MNVMNAVPTWHDWWIDQLETTHCIPKALAYRLYHAPFLLMARHAQRPPEGEWRTWLFMGGRGAGKTRAGAEWTRFAALFGGCTNIALVGPTLGDVREVMIDGPSGLRSIEPLPSQRPEFNVSRRRLEWPNGAIAHAFSAEDPDSLRGPQFDAAWCDEIGVWPDGEMVGNNLQLGLRLGDDPRCMATTTPRPVPLILRLAGGDAVVTHGRTRDNSKHLARGFVKTMENTFAGTVLERQELEGELVEDLAGALWQRSDIERFRILRRPEAFEDIILAIDPPASAQSNADACGIIVAGKTQTMEYGAQCVVLADGTVRGAKPSDWAERAVRLADEMGASVIIAEANQGGEMVRAVLESAGARLPIYLVHARLGKQARALPVAMLYAKGQVAHLGVFKHLEDQMCRFGAKGFVGSPDRVDALVWAISSLMLQNNCPPRIHQL